MKKDCSLIATLPNLSNMELVEQVISNPFISEVRFNTGTHTPYTIAETLSILKELCNKYKKKLWIDIKGRQLRVAKWADPVYSCIELNHCVEVSYPAKIYFRNGDGCNITHIRSGNKLFVSPLPKYALGAGQSVNIIADDVQISGYLTQTDKRYLLICRKMRLPFIMASFVEQPEDLDEIRKYMPKANIVSKIESQKGLDFISQNEIKPSSLMAARDDLYLQTGQNIKMLEHLKLIVSKDPEAICASRIFLSLEKGDCASFADFADLELMYSIGYKKFMLCDNVCNYAFELAIEAWRNFVYE